MNNFKVMMNGIIKENPTFVLLLGMCPTLGTTSSAINGMGMGLATMFVSVSYTHLAAILSTRHWQAAYSCCFLSRCR